MASTATAQARFDLARVVRHTFGALRANAASFAILALVLAGIPALVNSVGVGSLLMNGFSASGRPDFGAWLAILKANAALAGTGWLISFAANAVLKGAIVFGTAAYLGDRPASLGECFSAGLRNCLPLIGLMLLAFIGEAMGFVLLIVPGVMMAVAWSVVIPALVVERTGVFGAFSRSADLTRGRRWPIFGLMLIGFFAIGVVQQVANNLAGLIFAAATPRAALIQQMPVSGVIGVVTSVLISAGYAAIYYELRVTREGIGPEALAAVFD